MTKQNLVKQEYKNLLNKIYKDAKDNLPSIFEETKQWVNYYENYLRETICTMRYRYNCDKENFVKSFGLLNTGSRPEKNLNAYEELLFQTFKTDVYENENHNGMPELLGLLKEYANEVYKSNPNNIYAQAIAYSFENAVKEFNVEEQYEAINENIEQNNFLDELAKIDKLHNKTFDYSKLTTDNLKTLESFYEAKLEECQTDIEDKSDLTIEAMKNKKLVKTYGKKVDEVKEVLNSRKQVLKAEQER
jgi:hypothetical protein